MSDIDEFLTQRDNEWKQTRKSSAALEDLLESMRPEPYFARNKSSRRRSKENTENTETANTRTTHPGPFRIPYNSSSSGTSDTSGMPSPGAPSVYYDVAINNFPTSSDNATIVRHWINSWYAGSMTKTDSDRFLINTEMKDRIGQVQLTGADLRRLTKNALRSYLLRIGFSDIDAAGIAEDVQSIKAAEAQFGGLILGIS